MWRRLEVRGWKDWRQEEERLKVRGWREEVGGSGFRSDRGPLTSILRPLCHCLLDLSREATAARKAWLMSYMKRPTLPGISSIEERNRGCQRNRVLVWLTVSTLGNIRCQYTP